MQASAGGRLTLPPMDTPTALLIYAGWLLGWSLVGAVLFAWDKRAAIKGRSRVPEKTLLTVELLGGFPGCLLAGRLLRHKTVKRSYRAKRVVVILLHLAAVGGALYARV